MLVIHSRKYKEYELGALVLVIHSKKDKEFGLGGRAGGSVQEV